MYIEKLKLENYRNFKKLYLEFDKGINMVLGNNAVGKTNILECIYLLSRGRSFKTQRLNEIINYDENNL